MSKMMTAIALAALLVTPAAAKTVAYKHSSADSLRGLYMQAGSMHSALEVVGADNRVRRDPDPNIRVQLHREYLEGE